MEITITVTPEEINVIGEALSQLPYRISAPIIAKLHNQVNSPVPTQELQEPQTTE